MFLKNSRERGTYQSSVFPVSLQHSLASLPLPVESVAYSLLRQRPCSTLAELVAAESIGPVMVAVAVASA